MPLSPLRHSVPSTSAPRVSSPLATMSSSFEDSDDSESEESGSEAEQALNDEEDDDEESMEQLLQSARDRARARLDGSASTAAKDPLNLEDVALDEMDQDALPAVYTRHAVASQVFTGGEDVKGKGRAALAANNDNSPLLPGITSKWGELPRAKRTKSQKRMDTSTSAGRQWFDLPRRAATSLSDAEKREIQALRLGNAMDPKRFMRGEAKREGKKLPEFFQTGYIIDSSQSARAGLSAPSSKINKTSFLSSLMSDTKGQEWARRKYAQVQEKAQSGGKGYYKKKMGMRGSNGGGFGGKGKGKGKKRN